MDQARRQAPAELRSLWKVVTKEDFKALAEGFPGVAKAAVLDANDCPTIRYLSVLLAVAPSGGGLPSPLLKAQLAGFLEARKVVTVEVRLADPAYKAIHVGAEVYAYAGEDLTLVRGRLEQALSAFFAFDAVTFGQAIRVSDLVALLDGAPGVSYVRLNTPQSDVVLRPGEIPVTHAPAGEAWEFETTFIAASPSPFLYWIYADRDHFFVVTKLGASYLGQYTGLLRRYWSGRVATTQAAVAAGANVTLPVDDASMLEAPEYYVIQDRQHTQRARVIARDTASAPHTVTLETLLNAFESGARLGENPQPLIVGCSRSPGGFYAVNRFDGYISPTGQPGACLLAGGGAVAFSAPDARYGRHMLFPWLAVMSGEGARELRGELIGVFGLGAGGADSEDLLEIGGERYRVFNLAGPGLCAVREA